MCLSLDLGTSLISWEIGGCIPFTTQVTMVRKIVVLNHHILKQIPKTTHCTHFAFQRPFPSLFRFR